MSVHTWGEAPQGLWHLEIRNEGKYTGELVLLAAINYGVWFPFLSFSTSFVLSSADYMHKYTHMLVLSVGFHFLNYHY